MAKKLLLAEDSLTIQKVFSLTFQKSDISLTTVDNGEDALRLAGEISPDLVVADVTLADKSGFEVAAALRGAEKTRSCPILILAGSLPPFDEERFRQCGANAVLFKPFESQELIDKVDALLREGEVPVGAAAEEAGTGAGEVWDFSDVLEEVEEEVGKPAAPAQAAAALLPEDAGSAFRGEEARSLGEFDVSLEDIAREAEGPEHLSAPEPAGFEEPSVPEAAVDSRTGDETEELEEELPLLDLQAEDLGFGELPAVGEEIPSAQEVPEGVLEEVSEEGEQRVETDAEDLVVETPVQSVPPVEVPLERIPDRVLETAPFVPPDPTVAKLTAVPEESLIPEGGDLDQDEAQAGIFAAEGTRIREEFSGKVREILEKVAAETVEKVMWEMMERLSGEIRQQIREAVEAVAWDVIPATAESLIREEIERIRGKAAE